MEEGFFGQNCYLLGDSGYSLTNYLLTPVRNPVHPAEHLYNESHIRTRNVVERSYGIRKRFPILRLEMRVKLETIQSIIVATAILHNIALTMNDEEPEILHPNDDHDDMHFEFEGVAANQENFVLREQVINNYFSNL